jgi:deoxyribose-phosphate aldolase
VEVCLLTEEEKIKACQVVTAAGAEYIKTSTGFASKGATREDVVLFRQHIGPNVKIKASGGINTLEQAEEFLKLGADRLGSSRLVKLVKEQEGA